MTSKKVTKAYIGKILFLHGYTQSSSIFYAKTSALRKRLTKLNYKCVYLNAPLKLTPAQLPSNDALSKFASVVHNDEDDDTEYRAWWVKPQNTNDGISLDDAIDTIKNYIRNGKLIADPDLNQDNDEEDEQLKSLPITGIVGFSQGASLAGILIHKFKDLFNVPPPKFVIMYSGFKLDTSVKSGNDKYDDYYAKEDKKINDYNYLHVYGELDTVVDETRSLSLYNITKSNSVLLKHPGGHFVPNSKIYIDQVTNWIQVVTKEYEAKDENKKKTVAVDDDIDSLLDMIDNLGKA
ncbi:dihydrofolate reductase [Scheffersomyces amazonensis]|uniref:dihydrofolate reductase n=1 Tax=Scheffersomyces amazonensis TaxID=1078765 RepID=UPI00315DF0A9